MTGAAMGTVIITRCRPNILPFFGASIALVEISKEPLPHGKLSTSKALNSGTVMLPSS